MKSNPFKFTQFYWPVVSDTTMPRLEFFDFDIGIFSIFSICTFLDFIPGYWNFIEWFIESFYSVIWSTYFIDGAYFQKFDPIDYRLRWRFSIQSIPLRDFRLLEFGFLGNEFKSNFGSNFWQNNRLQMIPRTVLWQAWNSRNGHILSHFLNSSKQI